MTLYRFALWPPSEAWRNGYLWGAPLRMFRQKYAEKVKLHGPALRVWETDNAKPADGPA